MEVGHVDGAVHGLPQRMGQALLRNMGELHYSKNISIREATTIEISRYGNLMKVVKASKTSQNSMIFLFKLLSSSFIHGQTTDQN